MGIPVRVNPTDGAVSAVTSPGNIIDSETATRSSTHVCYVWLLLPLLALSATQWGRGTETTRNSSRSHSRIVIAFIKMSTVSTRSPVLLIQPSYSCLLSLIKFKILTNITQTQGRTKNIYKINKNVQLK